MVYYFVSYAWYSEKQEGFGSLEMELAYPVKTYHDIKAMKKWLDENVKDKHGLPCECVVLNYIKLKDKSRGD